MFRATDYGQRIPHIKLAQEVESKFATGDLKFGDGRRQVQVESSHRVAFTQPEALHGTRCYLQQGRDVRVISVRQKQSVARDQVYESFERGLNRAQVFENIRVIELQIVDDPNLRQVMHKLAPFIKKRRVVFVPLDNKPFALGKSCSLPEVGRNSTDQVAR